MNKQNNLAPDAEEKIEAAIDKTESYIEKNFKTLLISVAVVIVATISYFFMSNSSSTADLEASEVAYIAEQYFQQDSFNLALNGGSNFEGFISIADNYSSTSVGNIANHYAGICYYKLGDMDNAALYLTKYKAVKGLASIIINAQNIGLQGDVASQKGDYATAISLYTKASALENELTSPFYLKKAGMLYEKEGNNAKALELYQSIKDNYLASSEARDIDKFIGRVSQ